MTASFNSYRSPQELKTAAKINLDGQWLIAIIMTVVTWLLLSAFTGGNGANAAYKFAMEDGHLVKIAGDRTAFKNLMTIVSLILSGPIYFGLAGYFLKLARREPAEFSELFSGFNLFKTNFITNLLIVIFSTLWFLLLIVPGIIALIKYSMAYYILNDNPGLTAMEAIARSKTMMEGHKMRFFEMWLSFLGWFLLGIITFGLGMMYALPYYRAAKANFYLDLKQSYQV
jgi:uncharacterized membrane protein